MVNNALLDFFGKSPMDFKQWHSESDTMNIAMGSISETITESVRRGVLLAINDAFGNK